MRIVLALVALTGAALGCAQAVPLDDAPQAACKGGQSVVPDGAPPPTDSAESVDTAVSDAFVDDTAVVEEDTRVDPPDTSGDPCTDCMTTSCGTEISACFSDSECSALMDCLSACTDDACASACVSAHPSSTYDAFVTCATTSCSAACGAV